MALSGSQKTGIGIIGFIGRAYAAFVAKTDATVLPTPNGRNLHVLGQLRNVEILESKRNVEILDN